MEATQKKQQEPKQRSQEKKRPAFQMPKKRKKWLKRLAVLAVLGAVGYWFVLRPMQAGGKAVPDGLYLANAAQRMDLTVSVSGSGTVTPIESYKVGALVTGTVLEAPFEEGDRVEKGDMLYLIDAGDAEVGLRQAELALRQAQLNEQELSTNLTPSASAAGVVQKVYVQKGDLVSAGSSIADIADTSTMTLLLPFQSADAVQLSAGQSAVVTIAGTLETLPGTVESVSSADLVGSGGALVRQVKIRVSNPGALTTANTATATVGEFACAGSGSFEETMRQTVVAQTSGEVTALHVTAGSRVSAGTALVTLGGSTAQSTLENASISLENAKLSLQRAQDALENYTILAPISGTVVEKNFKAGDKIETESLSAANGCLAMLYDMSTLTFKMDINDLDINKLALGQEVRVSAAALDGQTFTGYVDKININGVTTNGFTTYPVTIRLEGEGNQLAEAGLKPGMNISAEIVVEEAQQVLCLPVDAVERGNTVLVAGAGALNEAGELVDPSKLEEREITLGRNNADWIEVVDGLEEGETVYTYNQASSAIMG
ncbi:MAG: efflux RND transporter periplasmic adaptor subunit [Lawsonibacter sp.]